MKKLTALLSILIVSAGVSAQNSAYWPFDTNGPVGECLFPENEKGEAEMSGVVECDGKDAAAILAGIEEYVRMLDSDNQADIDDIRLYQNRLTFKVDLNVRHYSEIEFACTVLAKDGKFKYTLSGFNTERQTIRGEAISEGPSNKLHWQRVNSLTKERNVYAQHHRNFEMKQKYIAYNNQIALEEQLYQDEYQSVLDFIDGLSKVFVVEDF